MKVRVKKGKKGFIYGRLRVRDDEGKGRDVFDLKPVNHSTEEDEKGDPLVITAAQQFSPKWMEKVSAKPGPKPKAEKQEAGQ